MIENDISENNFSVSKIFPAPGRICKSCKLCGVGCRCLKSLSIFLYSEVWQISSLFFFFFFRHDNVVFHSSRKDGDKSKPILDTIVVIQATIGCPFSFELDAKYSNICQNLLIHSAVFVVIRNTPIFGSPLFIPF